jgi:hypothetical protein
MSIFEADMPKENSHSFHSLQIRPRMYDEIIKHRERNEFNLKKINEVVIYFLISIFLDKKIRKKESKVCKIEITMNSVNYRLINVFDVIELSRLIT